MSAKLPNPVAANDARFLQPVISNAKYNPTVATAQFPPVQVVHCCTPVCHVKRSIVALPYPTNNPEFTKRVSQEAWRQLNADLLEQIYLETPYCLWAWKGFEALHRFNIPHHRALYKVIAHYNRHLFHPMMIDAQIFAEHDTVGIRRFAPLEHQYFVGFLIASSPAELQAFPRPEPGVSTGYLEFLFLPHSCKCCTCCPSFSNFHIENPTEVPETVPETCSLPPAMHTHTAEFLSREPETLVGCDCWAWSPIPASERRRAAADVKPASHMHVYKIPSGSATNVSYVPVPVQSVSVTPVMVPVASAGSGAYASSGDMLPSKLDGYEMVPMPVQQSMARDEEA